VFAISVDDVIDGPSKRLSEGFALHRSRGFADGHQLTEFPFTRAGLFQLAREQTVRHHDAIHVPGLALHVTTLTLAHAEFLFPVPVKGLGPRLAITLHQPDPIHVRGPSIHHQYLAFASLLLVALAPKDHHAHSVRDFERPQLLPCEITLARDASADLLPVSDTNRHRADALLCNLPARIPIHLQVVRVDE
jgi:hypothetical protein